LLKNRDLWSYRPSILVHARFPRGTNLVEGTNYKIQLIKRLAYDYRDNARCFHKLRAAFARVWR
jgi:transposase